MDEAEPLEPEAETWEELAQRVTAEVHDMAYARRLFDAMQAYRLAGFSDEQAWELTLEEHGHRLDLMSQAAAHNLWVQESKEDEEGP
jgi:hypothetical protein